MIEVQDIVKDFKLTRKIRKEMGTEFKNKKSLRAVDKISFTCQPGRIFALAGPNGAGKTTILRMIATMLKPTSGTIEVGGYDCQKNPQKVREKIGIMTDQTALYDRLTPYEMVKYIADLHGMDSSVFKSRKDKILNLSVDLVRIFLVDVKSLFKQPRYGLFYFLPPFLLVQYQY